MKKRRRAWNSTLPAPEKPLDRKSWLNRKTPLRPKGRRAKRDRESGRVFGPLCDYVRDAGCVARHLGGCGGAVEAHHVRSRGAGWADWLPTGEGNVVGLCHAHHMEAQAYRLDMELGALAREFGRQFKEAA